MSWTFTTSAISIIRAGAQANATIVADAVSLALFSDQAEGEIEAKTRKTYVDDYATLPTNIKAALDKVASCMVAMDIICYDMTGYLGQEARTILDFLDDVITRNLKVLEDWKMPQTPP